MRLERISISLVVILLACIAIAFLVGRRIIHNKADGPIYAIFSQRAEDERVLNAIGAWIVLDSDIVVKAVPSRRSVPVNELLNLIRSGRYADLVMPSLDDGRCMTDRWGHPLYVELQPDGITIYHVTVRSSGPNGVDEGGKGDDIEAKGTYQVTH